jgi:NADH-quinone oxidoreductase subunit L
MEQYIQFFILIPLIGLILSFFPANKQEKALFGITVTTIILHLLAAAGFTIMWVLNGMEAMFFQGPTLYKSNNSEFSIDFYFDKVTMVYGMVSSAITFLVVWFSKTYVHREKGFKRFFNNILLFYTGINVIIFSGNFETLFIGWEMIGIASFFLIAFYRDRYLPVKNALKVISLYRLADICLLIAIWMCHHAFAKSITFLELSDLQAHHKVVIEEASFQILIPAVFLVAALVKSAQLPFSSWLPRAMEGPTSSSAIFYGSLSVHMGVFLLIRTAPLWEGNTVFQVIVFMFGLFTGIVATMISRVQSSVKTQLAYSSIAQIAIMFMEVALGFHTLALVHFSCNAFLRTYQLLVSPSVLNYLIHDQFFHFTPPQHDNKDTLWGKIKLTLYVLSVKEWNLDGFMYNLLWMPLKRMGGVFSFIKSHTYIYVCAPMFLGGLYLVYNQSILPVNAVHVLPVVFGLLALVTILKAFTERGDARIGWMLIILNQLFTSLSIGFNEQFDFTQIHIFLSGIVVSGIIGFWCLHQMLGNKESISLDSFHGHSYEHPRLTIAFLIACMGLSGFPITPTFIGEDLMMGHIHENQITLTVLTTLNFIVDGLAIYRIYARVFLGPHDKSYHELAYRSS